MKSSFFALAAVLGLSLNAAPHADKSQADIGRAVLPSVVNLTVVKADAAPAAPHTGKAQSAAMRAEVAPRGPGFQLADTGSRVVVQSVDPAIAAEAGLSKGDAVLRIGQETASSAAAVQETLHRQAATGHNAALLLVESGQNRRWVALPLG